jgi:hypothetical protein
MLGQNKIKTILQNSIPLSNVTVIPNYPVISDDNSNLLYLGDDGCVDSDNDVHIISKLEGGDTNFEEARLQYTKLDKTGTKLIESKTIATHNTGYDNPAIFDPKVAIDNEDNIHITWYINDGANHLSVWYMKIDENGEVLIPKMQIAPAETDWDLGTILLITTPLIIIGVASMIYFRRGKRANNQINSK